MRKTWTKEELIAFEDNIERLYLDNQIPAVFHMSGGNEEQLIEIYKDIKNGDYVLSHHRNHYHGLLHGISAEQMTENIINGKSMFVYDREKNFLVSAIIGGTPAIAAGIAWALKKKGSSQKVWCFVTDGIEDNGHFFEAVRYVEGFDLPCIFIIENNGMAVGASNKERWGKRAELEWGQYSCVKKYYYKMSRNHIRAPGMIDLSKLNKKTDLEYFPQIEYKSCNLSLSTKNEISYKNGIIEAMTKLGQDERVYFVGYSVAKGNIIDTIKNVSDEKKIETPVAENLMLGLGMGMAIEGFRPIVYFERHDFMTVGMDAIVNHIDKIERLSHGQYKVPVIIRAMCFDDGPFYSGPTHSQDFTSGLRALVSIPILEPRTGQEVLDAYDYAIKSNHSTIIIDRKSLY